MDRRLGRLEAVYQADSSTIRHCSYDIEWAIRWPCIDEDPGLRVGRIRAAHGLDLAGERRAITLAGWRLGLPQADVAILVDAGLDAVVTWAAMQAGAVQQEG